MVDYLGRGKGGGGEGGKSKSDGKKKKKCGLDGMGWDAVGCAGCNEHVVGDY